MRVVRERWNKKSTFVPAYAKCFPPFDYKGSERRKFVFNCIVLSVRLRNWLCKTVVESFQLLQSAPIASTRGSFIFIWHFFVEWLTFTFTFKIVKNVKEIQLQEEQQMFKMKYILFLTNFDDWSKDLWHWMKIAI